MILPFWNSELYVEISSWFPFGKDYQPVSVNRFYDGTLASIAGSCLDLESEFFFMASPSIGCVGNFPRENFFKFSPDSVLNLGFLMILGFSEKIERAVTLSLSKLDSAQELFAGITSCSIWSKDIYKGTAKVIAIASESPFFDCTDFLKGFAGVLESMKKITHSSDYAFYAEKFGYDRFFINWENSKLYDLRVTQVISELEYDDTKNLVGGSPNMDFPPFMGMIMSNKNEN